MENLEEKSPPPVILVSGIDGEAMQIASMALAWDLPAAVTVRHDLDPGRDVLTRTISDVTGALERIDLDLEHACVSCSIRHDIVPTLQRLATAGRWGAIVAQLPAAAEPCQVCRALALQSGHAPDVRIAAVVTALDADCLLADLIGGERLTELGLPVRPEDARGLSEVTCAMAEYADVVFTTGEPHPQEQEILHALMRPDAELVVSVGSLDARSLAAGVHRHESTEAWVEYVRRGPLPSLDLDTAWVLDFRSRLPMHPERLRQTVAVLGGGARRSRGCFWLPSRPRQTCLWEGAGGQLSVGIEGEWGLDEPFTRIVVIGIDDGKAQLEAAFRACLLTEAELEERGCFWEVGTDGLEPWLGPIRV